MQFQEDIRVSDKLTIKKNGPDGEGDRRVVLPGAPPVQQNLTVASNVCVSMVDPRTGKVVEKRRSHNIFINYGRDWAVHLMGLAATDTPFRSDRVQYMAIGVGGAQQQVASADMRDTGGYNYPGFPNDWAGGSGSGDPSQTHTDLTVLGLEWPVEVVSSEYYKKILQDHTFPGTGIIRLTAPFGINEVSFGTATSVPVSEIGLFTQRVDDSLGGQSTPPLVWPSETYAEKAMIAYNQFPTLHKTPGFVLQVDWELRFQ